MVEISYAPIIREMTWSFSRIKSFDDCPYRWRLRYLDRKQPARLFFASYGSFVHSILERYYKGELAKDQLLTTYLMEFRANVENTAPNYKIFQSYFSAGVNYFKNFAPLPFEPLEIEKRIDTKISGIPFVGYVDFIGRNENGIIPLDHKSRTLKPRSNRTKPTKTDLELDEFFRQPYLYLPAIEEAYGETPVALGFNCFRNKEPLIIEPYSEERRAEAETWLIESVNRITEETEFRPCMDFFKCRHLCEMHDHCEYYNMTWGDAK